jgi:hypothetical protein
MTKIHLLLLRMSGKICRGRISLTRYNEILGEFAFQLYSWRGFDQIRWQRGTDQNFFTKRLKGTTIATLNQSCSSFSAICSKRSVQVKNKDLARTNSRRANIHSNANPSHHSLPQSTASLAKIVNCGKDQEIQTGTLRVVRGFLEVCLLTTAIQRLTILMSARHFCGE